MEISADLRTAPRGQVRVLSVDGHTGQVSVERDFWQLNEAHGFIYEVEDDRPWLTFHIYDDRGEGVE